MTYTTYKTNKKGGYESLIVYWLATTIYDLTDLFCRTYKSNMTYRTYEQMTAAARSGKQNIVEGSLENSIEGNIKLTGISKASYGELLEDYRDYLRQHGLNVWDKNDTRVWKIRKTKDELDKTYKSYTTYTTYLSDPESFSNLLITLSYKQSYLLTKLLQAIEEKFIREGGIRESLFKKRREFISKH